MVVRFYEWDPNGSALGHASLTLPNGTHISWWPESEERATLATWLGINSVKGVAKSFGMSPLKMSTVLFSVPASMNYPIKPHCMPSYHDDIMLEGREADRKIKLRDCILDLEKVMTWWEEAKITKSYTLTTNNCATMVIKALEAGDATLFQAIPYYLMWTPYRVFEYCKKLSNARFSINEK